MTLQEMITAAAAYIDDDIEEEDALIAVNEAQAKLGDMAFVQDQITLPHDASEVRAWHELPPSLTRIVRVTQARDGKPYSAYQKSGQMIRFNSPGQYTITYRRMPKPITRLDEEPEVPQVFHGALVTYLRAWVRLKEDEDSQDGLRLIQEFYVDADRAYRTLLRSERKELGMQLRVERSPFA